MIFRNKKTGVMYDVCDDLGIINATNDQDGQKMILYADAKTGEHVYVREKKEFFEKFEKMEDCSE